MLTLEVLLASPIKLELAKILAFEKGSIIDLGAPAGDRAKILVNGKEMLTGNIIATEKKLAVKVAGKEKLCDRVLERSKPTRENIAKANNSLVECLKDMDVDVIFNAMRLFENSNTEYTSHPQLISVILLHLNTDKAADLLSKFPKDLSSEISLRSVRIKTIDFNILNDIAICIQNFFTKLPETQREIGGLAKVKSIVQKMDQKDVNNMVLLMAQVDSEVAKSLLDFTAVLSTDKNKIHKTLAKFKIEEVAVILSGKSDAEKDAIMARVTEKSRKRIMDVKMSEAAMLQKEALEKEFLLELIR